MGNDYGSNGLSASDVALLTGRNGGGNGNGWGDASGAWWIIILLLALGGFRGGFGGGYGGGSGSEGSTTFVPYNVGGFGGGFTMDNNEKPMQENMLEKVECKISQIINADGIKKDNIDYLYKLVDIHKDLKNEDYWNKKEEKIDDEIQRKLWQL